MATDFRNVLTSLKIAAMDAAWIEEKHHRADNGRFTSGSGRGKTGGSEEKGGGRDGKGDGERGKKEEMTQDAAEKIVREAFEKCGGEIEKMDLIEHHLSVKTNFTDLKALNKELGERGLKAKQESDKTLHIAEDAAEDYENDPFFKLLVCLMQIGFYAKDLHYGATGKSFYGIHELADLAWKFTRMFDDINEIHYMGELGTIPPSRQLVAFEASKGMEQLNDGEASALTTRQLIERVLGAVENAEEAIVAAKGIGCAAGTNAILDEISKDCLKVSGLLFQSLKNDDPPQPVNTDAIDRVIQKGIIIKPRATGQDAGTHEGAVKAAQTRKAHGGFMTPRERDDRVIQGVESGALTNPAFVKMAEYKKAYWDASGAERDAIRKHHDAEMSAQRGLQTMGEEMGRHAFNTAYGNPDLNKLPAHVIHHIKAQAMQAVKSLRDTLGRDVNPHTTVQKLKDHYTKEFNGLVSSAVKDPAFAHHYALGTLHEYKPNV